MSLLAVDRETPGCTITNTIGKLGHKGVELCEVHFDDARVPVANLLGGEEGRGLYQMLSALDRGLGGGLRTTAWPAGSGVRPPRHEQKGDGAGEIVIACLNGAGIIAAIAAAAMASGAG